MLKQYLETKGRIFLAEYAGDHNEVRRLADTTSKMANLSADADIGQIVGSAFADIPDLLITVAVGAPALMMRKSRELRTGNFDAFIGYPGADVEDELKIPETKNK